eukprot:TRINITY_DN2502_c0_g1_i2.p1 TRINITY_DN2502_c0_g1~~TRINITY_DN2502_c0_g1_i2.p1  ORF type:complete len:4005 (+),score=573.78 TRINITY_DN2502_c0_g1_i2:787-12801(+)
MHSTGVAGLVPAVLLLLLPCVKGSDECVGVSVCANSGQKCFDPDHNVANDWYCDCIGSGVGTKVGAAATCQYVGECKTQNVICTSFLVPPAGCEDPSSAANDWQCICIPPQTTVTAGVMGAMPVCELDECLVQRNLQTCTQAGQTCTDPDHSTGSLGDWKCECIAPDTGSAKAAAATCTTTGECTAQQSVCLAAGQHCVDPNTAVTGDWQCECVSPESGSPATGKAATCTLDECKVACPTCAGVSGSACTDLGYVCKDPVTTAASLNDWYCELDECLTNSGTCGSQTCNDPNKSILSTGDWTCNCVLPEVGSGTASVATCTLDECTVYSKQSVCGAVGQTCNDPNTAVSSTDDWTCTCALPATGSATAKAATCSYVGFCAGNATTCTSVGQSCFNNVPSGIFQCVCVAPATGTAGDQAPADCQLDECTAACSHCADTGNGLGNQCTKQSYPCIDPDKKESSLGDWYCQLDECTANGATCTSQSPPQTCNDPNDDSTKLNDWQCTCTVGTGTATAKAASCSFDECTANSNTCTGASQTCEDPDFTVTGDWTCKCAFPQVGTATAMVATCTLDECTTNSATCTSQGQKCNDPDKTVMSDWQCECVAPSTGTPATGMAATCTPSGECAANTATCAAAGQSCNDPDPMTANDWQCECISPATGTAAVAALATCTLDECVANGAACSAGQTCKDLDQTATGDWLCVCNPPTTGTGSQAAATCVLDECIANQATCASVGQQCKDPNTSPASQNDWTCNCVAPATGSPATVSAATCTNTGECATNANTCTAAGQSCNDPDPMTANDWQCECLSPETGTPGVMKAATCSLDECVANAATCATGQTCNDPDQSTKGNWVCTCNAPSTGTGNQAPASCKLDECLTNAATCTTAGQTCSDPNTSPSSTGDWVCNCVAPATGTATAKAATCTQVGECATNAMTCIAAGQSCDDPDTTMTGDWTCNCIAPASGTATAMVATCIIDECVANGATCTGASPPQTCTDPDKSPTSLDDWICGCVAPQSGSANAKVATCTYVSDCVANVLTCTAAGQTCNDPDLMVADNWECICPMPSTGSAVMMPAVCRLDECTTNGVVCTYRPNQTCNDPDPTVMGDWVCECTAPATGTGMQAAAICVYDECTANEKTCTAVAQTCNDPDTSAASTGDWTCNCVAPATGAPGIATVATCTQVGECVANANTCTSAGQNCDDPSTNVTGDWTCNCLAPMTGSATAKAATCKLDECIANGATCPTGQTCKDPDQTKDNDWECQCDAPTTGTGMQAAAACMLDECIANAKTCTSQGQTCNDTDKSVNSVADWACNCVAPATGTAIALPATCTQVGECVANSMTCAAAGQSCDDPDVSIAGDWTCNCVAPKTGSATTMVATCLLDECLVNSGTCSANQTCKDPDTSVSDNWVCECDAPYTGSAVAMAAACQIDECLINAMTCTSASQTCDDPDKSVSDDWTCTCVAPATGSATAMAAACTVDECIANGATCPSGQSCNDPDFTVDNDWTCDCDAPSTGSAQGMAATCRLDECVNNTVCSAAAQTCDDPDKTIPGDWTCNCVSPATGSGTGMVATCMQVGDCVANALTCTVAGQTCDDPNMAVAGDWTCNCLAPSTGKATAKVAKCILDECTINNATCPMGQTCNDPDTTVDNDWTCDCDAPTTGTARGAAATCIQDECVASLSTCAAAGQTCNDPDTSVGSLGDWTCDCVAPATGSATAGVATCTQVGECVANAMTCIAAGQSCDDPSTNVTDDWTCNCVTPATGSATASVANCTVDECIVNGVTCSMGQTCKDPDFTVDNDWECKCDAPATGSAVAMAATCSLDECIANGGTCTSVGQTCNDTDVTVVGDWTCNCVSPATGTPAVGAAATCTEVGECVANAMICTAAGQSCDDPNTNVTGDWTCNCVQPATGSATAKAASCLLDECITNAATCPAGQTCEDPDHSSIGDWVCNCDAPSTGTGNQAAALCSVDECLTNAKTCTSVGQTCNDTDTSPSSTGDWVCNCVAPATGTATAKAATCAEVGECVSKAPICTTAGQSCDDPNTNVTGDWTCNCVAPATGSANAKAATCAVDECVANVTLCPSGQTCKDANPTVKNDWTCDCNAPYVGKGIAKPAVCGVDECVLYADQCKVAGQACHDPDYSTTDDWTCVCISPATGTPSKGKPATCTQVGECIMYASTCIAVGQSCKDPNTTTSNDWTCECISPEAGSATGTTAVCSINECVSKAHFCHTGQTCRDPDLTVKDDWTCVCDTPAVGIATGGPATCLVDECILNGNTCNSQGQECNDPNFKVDNDWTCSCVAPAMGSPAVGRATTCMQFGECAMSSSVCSAANQSCEDPDPVLPGDLMCKCIAPATGTPSTYYPAVCHLDECTQYNATCPKGQTCFDPDTTVAGNWQCQCDAPSKGAATAGIATCTLDECMVTAHASVCSASGQLCSDPDTNKTNDWTCTCIAPATGPPSVRAPTNCSQLGECVANSMTCTAVGQSCDDPDLGAVGDWTCNCVTPLSGSATARVATCIVNECLINGTCPTGQTCNDPDHSVMGDWECTCDPPFKGSETAGNATCLLDECDKNKNTCHVEGQSCIDTNTDPTSTNDWICRCVPPATGADGVMSPAMCTQVGECVVNAPICTAVNQSCNDPIAWTMMDIKGDWECKCLAPTTGTGLTGPATCVLDECVANSDKCTVAGQTCRDPDTSVHSTDDWLCECKSPQKGVAQGKIASCVLNECEHNSTTCLDAGQQCRDLNTAPWSTDDWVCECIAPATGNRTIGAPATCTQVGECVANAMTCIAAQQSCNDPDPNTSGDWMCECIAPRTGSSLMGPVGTCSYDECLSNAQTCIKGQKCFDPDETVDDDWMCQCLAPFNGSAIGQAALCELNECITQSTTCTSVGQQCVDHSLQIENDWTCQCVSPASGSDIAAPANCTEVGECVDNAVVCNSAGQSCNDPDTNTTGDWECVCLQPGVGSATGAAATCILDECLVYGDICTSQGQRCDDPDTSSASTGDWTCTCIAPLSGGAVATAAICSPRGECATKQSICQAAGQECFDPDAGMPGDWRCNCIAPLNGTALGKVANCELDECIIQVNLDTCKTEGQLCVDPVKTNESRDDWMCACIPPATGSPQIGGSAICTQFGECVDNFMTCMAANQSCNDPDESMTNDWTCECIAPDVGVQGRPGFCDSTDECILNGVTCAQVGQTCRDPDKSIVGDWMCECVHLSGSAVGQIAICGQDECDVHGTVCTNQGQICNDANVAIVNDWTCECQGSGVGKAKQAAANCTWSGECADSKINSVCTAEGQTCKDPDPSNTGDWQCECVSPQTGTPGVNKKGNCSSLLSPAPVDECLQYGDECTSEGQECIDPDTASTALNNWLCTCVGSGTGSAVGRPANCSWAVPCNDPAVYTLCVTAGQTCVVNNTVNGTIWLCQCVGGFIGSQPFGPAQCIDPAAPQADGSGCTWPDETRCNNDATCVWSASRLTCEIRYCLSRTHTCEDDPICQYDYGKQLCLRTDCGTSTTEADCAQNIAGCQWMPNANGVLPVAKGPYDLAPSYCTLKEKTNDNRSLLQWLLLIGLALCACVICVFIAATLVRRKLRDIKERRLEHQAMQEKLMQPEREFAEMRRLEMQADELCYELEKEPPVAKSWLLVNGMEKDKYKKDVSLEPVEEEEEGNEEDESEHARALKDRLSELRITLASQCIEQEQRSDARAYERKKHALERVMDEEENRKERLKQLDRAKTSHALQLGVAQREAAKRQRERKREQELLLDIDQTQNQIMQQKRRQLEIAEKHDDLRGLGGHDADGRQAFVDGDTLKDAWKAQESDKGLELLIHGEDALSMGRSYTSMGSAEGEAEPAAQERRSIKRHVPGAGKPEASSVFLSGKPAEANVASSNPLKKGADFNPDWESKSLKSGIPFSERSAKAPTDMQSYYKTMVTDMVEDKLAATKVRRKMEGNDSSNEMMPQFNVPAGSGPGGEPYVSQWGQLLDGVVSTQRGDESYRAPELPSAPEGRRNVDVPNRVVI